MRRRRSRAGDRASRRRRKKGERMGVRIRKAVLPVAGLGTRFLPATRVLPKE
ncbi:MAG: UTP--glucose-1-phosphate uridylyltransferase, partial [Rhodothalassiaceae bacterium]